MNHTIIDARKALAAQPFSRLIGAELTQYASERVELRVPITDAVKQQYGFVHGGIVSYAADNALTFAASTALGTSILTSEYKINYLRPATGDWLIARAWVVHAGKRQAACRCDVFFTRIGEELLCAIAQGTITLAGKLDNA